MCRFFVFCCCFCYEKMPKILNFKQTNNNLNLAFYYYLLLLFHPRSYIASHKPAFPCIPIKKWLYQKFMVQRYTCIQIYKYIMKNSVLYETDSESTLQTITHSLLGMVMQQVALTPHSRQVPCFAGFGPFCAFSVCSSSFYVDSPVITASSCMQLFTL